jgi:ribosomal protein L40E
MSMMPCRECGAPVSSEARRCPNCGINGPTPGSASLRAKQMWALRVFLIALGLFIAFVVLDYVIIPLLADG